MLLLCLAVLMANRRRVDCQRDHFSLVTIREGGMKSQGGGGWKKRGRVSSRALRRAPKYFAYEKDRSLPSLSFSTFKPIHKLLSLLSRGMRHEWQLECISRLTLGVRGWGEGGKITSIHASGDAFRPGVHVVSRIGFSRESSDRCVYVCACACMCLRATRGAATRNEPAIWSIVNLDRRDPLNPAPILPSKRFLNRIRLRINCM